MASFKTNNKKKHHNKWHWTRQEDACLTALIQRYGPGNWNRIANHIRGRTGKSCRLRWINQLNPKIDKRPFTEEEQQRLLQLHGRHGNRWSTFVNFFPGRTDNQLKNQYHVLVGSRHMKAFDSSYCPDPCIPLTRGPTDLSRYGNAPTVHVTSQQFSNVPFPGNWLSGFAQPFFTTAADNKQIEGGSPSSIGKAENWFTVHYSNVTGLCQNSANIPSDNITSPGNSVMSNANSSEVSEVQPQEGVVREYQFFNFLGVLQSSE